jgi:hypothetical protein
MATVRVSHQPHPGAIYRTLGARNGGVARDIYRRGLQVQARARQLVGVDTGHLRSRILVELVPSRDGLWAARIGANVRYARVHHEGHGWIFPVHARVLAFKPKGSGEVIFRPRVRPVAGTKFLTRALPAGRR